MISYKTNPPHMYCPHCLNPCITHKDTAFDKSAFKKFVFEIWAPIPIQHYKITSGYNTADSKNVLICCPPGWESFMSDHLCFTTPVSATSTCVLVLFEQYEQPKKCVQERFSSSFLMHMLCKN